MTTKFSIWHLSLITLFTASSHADGLSDLKGALTRLQSQTPIKASLEVKTWDRNGEDKDLRETQGDAVAAIEDGPRGLQVLLSPDILSRAEAENRQKGKNPEAKTPTVYALQALGATELHPLTSTTSSLRQVLEEATFKEEKPDTYAGKPARVLRFEYSIDKLSKADRKYVKKFDMSFDLWIDADGTPLASRLHETASGRAFLVVSFEQSSTEECVYAKLGDRLYTTRKVVEESSAGAGEKNQRKVIKTLQLQS